MKMIKMSKDGKIERIEVAPVRHGRWIIDDGDDGFCCSECNHFVPWEDTFALGWSNWNKQLEYYEYCRCGAKMDLKENDMKGEESNA